MPATKKHTAKVAWFYKGRYCWKLFKTLSQAEQWAAAQVHPMSYIGEASWSEHKIFKQDERSRESAE